MTSANYETGLAATDDIPAILAMQDVNLHENGGGLSVRQTADWFRRTMSEMPIVVARRDGVVVGYALATSIAAKSHVGIVQTMLRAFPAPPNCYLYGPVCVAESERGSGLAAMMYQEMLNVCPGVRRCHSYVPTTSRRSGPTERWGKWNSANSCTTASPTLYSHLPAEYMSALPPRADMCGATRDVRFGPLADMSKFSSYVLDALLRALSIWSAQPGL